METLWVLTVIVLSVSSGNHNAGRSVNMLVERFQSQDACEKAVKFFVSGQALDSDGKTGVKAECTLDTSLGKLQRKAE